MSRLVSGVKFGGWNASKTKTMIVSRSRKIHLQSPALTIGGTVLKDCDWEWHLIPRWLLRSSSLVCRAASQRLVVLRMSWQVFDDRMLFVRWFRGFVLPVLEHCSAMWCSDADTHLKLLDRVVRVPVSQLGVCLSLILHIVDLWLYYVWCARSGVTQCTFFMVLYLSCMCRCVLHAVPWSHIGTLMRLLAAEPRSIIGLLFFCKYLCRTILVTPYSMVWDCWVSRTGPMTFYWPSFSFPFWCLLVSISFLSFYGLILWGWGRRTDTVLITLSRPCTANLFK